MQARLELSASRLSSHVTAKQHVRGSGLNATLLELIKIHASQIGNVIDLLFTFKLLDQTRN